jgi:hypothetical protein
MLDPNLDTPTTDRQDPKREKDSTDKEDASSAYPHKFIELPTTMTP